MPYNKGTHPKCNQGQIAVVKTSDGSLKGCHDSESSANAQLAALAIAEKGRSERDAPTYRKADDGAAANCNSCTFGGNGLCRLYDFEYTAGWVCDVWRSQRVTPLSEHEKAQLTPLTVEEPNNGSTFIVDELNVDSMFVGSEGLRELPIYGRVAERLENTGVRSGGSFSVPVEKTTSIITDVGTPLAPTQRQAGGAVSTQRVFISGYDGLHKWNEDEKSRMSAIVRDELKKAFRIHGSDHSTSIMIAFYPSPSVARAFAIDGEGAIDESELHATIALLGSIDTTDLDREMIARALRDFAASHTSVQTSILGIGRFYGRTQPEDADDSVQDAIHLVLEQDEFVEFRTLLLDSFMEAGIEDIRKFSFSNPHITLAYVDSDDPGDIDASEAERFFAFDSVSLIWGDERTDFPLNNISQRSEAGMTQFIRAFPEVADRADELNGDPSLPVPWIASTEGIKLDGKNLRAKDWDLGRFEQYGAILYGHDFIGARALPIGLGIARIERGQLKIDVTYDQDDEFAMRVRAKALKGMMAGSVSWDPKNGRNVLTEFSNVNVGIDPDSLPDVQRAGLRALQLDIVAALDDEEGSATLIEQVRTMVWEALTERGALPPHLAPLADENAEYQRDLEIAAAGTSEVKLRNIHAWIDINGHRDSKDSYRLAHQEADSGEVVLEGVYSAIASINEANIPAHDRAGVLRHLNAHLKQFGKPQVDKRAMLEYLETIDSLDSHEGRLGMQEFYYLIGRKQMLEQNELKNLVNDYPEKFSRVFDLPKGPDEEEGDEKLSLREITEELLQETVDALSEERVGAALSRKNREKLDTALELIRDVVSGSQEEELTLRGEGTDDDPPNDEYTNAVQTLSELVNSKSIVVSA